MADASAAGIMNRFAERTGITSPEPQRRYLWTDAFAVCNFLGLERRGDDPEGEAKALTLIDLVHHTLGRHRENDERQGWISGLTGDEAEAHPTAGGLRIGKPLPERAVEERADPRLEWDQDGQYFHYLTRWMHALDQTAWRTGDATCNRWARELAAVAFRAFSYRSSAIAARRMVWKMSIDLSRPLVPSMGHHDPLDGYITCLQLRATARALSPGTELAHTEPENTLVHETRELRAMVRGGDWATDDPLGLGSLMTDAYRLFQIERAGAAVPEELLNALHSGIRIGLDHLKQQNAWDLPADRRLPFRELGLVIGIRALERLAANAPVDDGRGRPDELRSLGAQRPLADRLIEFWLHPRHQQATTWAGHQDINDVMLATALAPEGYVELRD